MDQNSAIFSPGPKGRLGFGNAVAIIIAAGIGAVLFTLGAGAVLYNNTRTLTTAAQWVQHTQEVLTSLQRATFLAERVEYRARLYTLDGDDDDLGRARGAVNALVTSSSHIRSLVADNPNQIASADDLAACVSRLANLLTAFSKQSTVPTVQVQECQKIISLMTDQEQLLLTERAEHSHDRHITAISTEIFLIPISILCVVGLFALLLRDAIHRQLAEREAQRMNDDLGHSIRALEETARESELMTAARNELQLCVEVQQVYSTAGISFSRLLPGTSGCLYIINNSRNHVEVVSAWGEASHDDFSPPESCCSLRSGQARWRQPGVSEIHCSHFSGAIPDRYHCSPIVAYGNTIGMLYIQCENDENIRQVNQRMDAVRQLVQITALAIANLNLRAKLENQSIRDSLTGLFNRHFMQISLDREMARAHRRKQIMAVLMLDVDHFKIFNDTHGHAAGDEVLRAFAQVFKNNIRAEDIVCRYGGEEFTIILPDSMVKGACDRADSIVSAISDLKVRFGQETFEGFGISIGIAFYPGDGDSSDQLLQRADAALYEAKRNGRGQVSLYERAFSVK